MHKIVFSGTLVDGADPAAVRKKVAQLFRLHDKSTLDRLFSGDPVVIRKNLDAATARRIRDALRKAGALCRVEPALPPVKPPPPPPPPKTDGLSLVPTEEEAAEEQEQQDQDNPFAVRDLSTPPADPSTPVSGHRARARAAPAAPAANRTGKPVNNSGQPGASLPEEARGLSWGGFFLSWIWGIGNNTWIALLALLPVVNLIVPFWLLFTGREKAWRNRRWRDLEHFRRVQRNWGAAGLVLALVTGWFLWSVITGAQEQAQRMQSTISGDDRAFEERLREIDDPEVRASLRELREAAREASRR